LCGTHLFATSVLQSYKTLYSFIMSKVKAEHIFNIIPIGDIRVRPEFANDK